MDVSGESKNISFNVVRALGKEVLSQLHLVDSISHPSETGRARESIIRSFLRAFVPPAYGIDTGFVVDAHGRICKQVDIVVYRTGYHPVFEIGGVRQFLIESVAAVIENKARISDEQTLRSALANI